MFKKRKAKGSETSKRRRINSSNWQEEPGNLTVSEGSETATDLVSIANYDNDKSNDSREKPTMTETSETLSEGHISEDVVLESNLQTDSGNKVVNSLAGNASSTLSTVSAEGPRQVAHEAAIKVLDPKKQTSNIRTTLFMDYQPDICKDYKQTGYCGYGDSCKFLHSRDDFKSGWKLHPDWKIDADTSISVVKDIPFKCLICRNDYKAPIVTECGHYFCSSCFMQRAKKDTTCAVCRKDTHGVAKSAKKLKEILKSREKSN